MDPKQISTKTFKNYQKYLLNYSEKKYRKKKRNRGNIPKLFRSITVIIIPGKVITRKENSRFIYMQ